MRGIIATSWATIIAELIVGLIAMHFGWEIGTIVVVLGAVMVGFWGTGISLLFWANKGR